MDDTCIQLCEKSSAITNLKKEKFFIEKTKGKYNQIINAINFLNTAIMTDLPDLFAGFFIDLSDLKTETIIEMDKPGVINLFENLLNGNIDSDKELRQVIHPSTNDQYIKGI